MFAYRVTVPAQIREVVLQFKSIHACRSSVMLLQVANDLSMPRPSALEYVTGSWGTSDSPHGPSDRLRHENTDRNVGTTETYYASTTILHGSTHIWGITRSALIAVHSGTSEVGLVIAGKRF